MNYYLKLPGEDCVQEAIDDHYEPYKSLQEILLDIPKSGSWEHSLYYPIEVYKNKTRPRLVCTLDDYPRTVIQWLLNL